MNAATPGQARFTWDYRQPAPIDEIAAAVRELSGGTVRMSMPATGGDEYELVIAAQDARPAPGMHPLSGLIANSYALYKFAQGGEWLTCEDDGRLDMRKELLAVKAAVREALKGTLEPKPAPALAAAIQDIIDRYPEQQPAPVSPAGPELPRGQRAEPKPAPELAAPRRPRLKGCVEAWPQCSTGEYNPACCRFPKSCSCDAYDPEQVTPEILEQPQPAPELAADGDGNYEPGSIDLPSGEHDITEFPVADARELAAAMAAHMDELAANYPENVFPATSDTRDAISGTAMRHAYRTAARLIRERAGLPS